MILCTDKPSVATQGERIVITLPSGKDNVQIALDLHQALHVLAGLGRETVDTFKTGFAAPPAEVVPFTRKRRKARAPV